MSFSGAGVAVVVPVHNRFEYLIETLETVLNQSCPPTEVIVVDDGSRSPVSEFLADWPLRDRVKVVVNERALGVSGARNRGWQSATTDLVAFIDSDDLWMPSKLEAQLRHLAQNPEAHGVYTGMEAFYPDGSTEGWANNRPARLTTASALQGYTISVQSLLIRKDVLAAVGGFDGKYKILDDHDLSIRLPQAGFRIDFIGDQLVRHRRHNANYSDNHRKYLRENLSLTRRYWDATNECYGPGAARVRVGVCIQHFADHVRFMGLPARTLTKLLAWSAPRSRMPLRFYDDDAVLTGKAFAPNAGASGDGVSK